MNMKFIGVMATLYAVAHALALMVGPDIVVCDDSTVASPSMIDTLISAVLLLFVASMTYTFFSRSRWPEYWDSAGRLRVAGYIMLLETLWSLVSMFSAKAQTCIEAQTALERDWVVLGVGQLLAGTFVAYAAFTAIVRARRPQQLERRL